MSEQRFMVAFAGEGHSDPGGSDRIMSIGTLDTIIGFGGASGLSHRALSELCLAAAKGIPYIVCAPRYSALEGQEAVVHGADVVILADMDRDRLQSIAIRCFANNPKRNWLCPLDPQLLDELWPLCESPIEKRLAVHLFGQASKGTVIKAQVPVETSSGNYRLDFALDPEGKKIAVECDGHDFHERTKEQATRDKSRDRALLAAGWRVARFTGSEIWSDPWRCALEALSLLGNE